MTSTKILPNPACYAGFLVDYDPTQVVGYTAYQTTRRNSDLQNARLEHADALRRLIPSIVQSNAKLYNAYTGNPRFSTWLGIKTFWFSYTPDAQSLDARLHAQATVSSKAVTAIKFGSAIVTLVFALACSAGAPSDETLSRQDYIPTPDRSQVVIIDRGLPDGLTDPAASAAYTQGYSHMLDAAWFSAIAAYDEAIRIQPDVAGLYEARGTAYMYAGRHDNALADYGLPVELDPEDDGHWRRRSHAHTIAPTPQPEKGVEDATRAIELDPGHPMGYGHRAIGLTQLPTPDWQNALADMDRHIGLFTSHDPEAYRLRAWIHDNLDNHQEAERDRRVVH